MKGFTIAVAVLVFVVAASSHPVDDEETRTSIEETARSVVNVRTHPTVRCEHITPVKGEKSGDNHRACSSHCRSLEVGRNEGKCLDGMCHCEYDAETHGEEVHPTVKCSDLVPDHGRTHSNNHEACKAHCKSLKNGYKRGQCSKGMCNCHFH